LRTTDLVANPVLSSQNNGICQN